MHVHVQQNLEHLFSKVRNAKDTTREWSNRKYVIDYGLFHSIGSTSAYSKYLFG